MNKTHALALAALLLSSSSSAWSQQPTPQASEPAFNALGRPTFLTKEKIEALQAQQSGQPPASAVPAKRAKAASSEESDEGSGARAASAENAENAAVAVAGKGIPLPPLPPLPTGKGGEQAPAPDRSASNASAPTAQGGSPKSAPAAEPVADTRKVFDGRLETTPPALQWGYETINRQEARWSEREAEYARRFQSLGSSSNAR